MRTPFRLLFAVIIYILYIIAAILYTVWMFKFPLVTFFVFNDYYVLLDTCETRKWRTVFHWALNIDNINNQFY